MSTRPEPWFRHLPCSDTTHRNAVVAGRFHPPSVANGGRTAGWYVSADRDNRLVIIQSVVELFSIPQNKFVYRTISTLVPFAELQQASRQWVDQGVQSLSMPLETFSDNVDVNIWSEFAHTAISGYRAVTVHLQSGLHEGQFDFSLHLTDWRVRAERYKDSIHTGPFGGRPACTVPLPPLPVPDDPFVRRPSFAVPLSPPPLLDAVPRQHNEAEWIALGSPWDRTVPAANMLHTLIPNYVIRHRGQKRTVANIFLGVDLHEGDIEWVKADADHLYICLKRSCDIVCNDGLKLLVFAF